MTDVAEASSRMVAAPVALVESRMVINNSPSLGEWRLRGLRLAHLLFWEDL